MEYSYVFDNVEMQVQGNVKEFQVNSELPTYRFTPSESNEAKRTNGKLISGYLAQGTLAMQRKISIVFKHWSQQVGRS